MILGPAAALPARPVPAAAEVLAAHDLLELVAVQGSGEPAGDEVHDQEAGLTSIHRLRAWAALRAVSRSFRRAAEGARVVGAMARVHAAGVETCQDLLGAARRQRNWSEGRCRRVVLRRGPGRVRCLALSPDGAQLACSSRRGIVHLWNLRAEPAACTALAGHHRPVATIGFAGDGSHLASGSEDGTARVWSLGDSTEARGVLVGHRTAVQAVTFGRGATVAASGSRDGGVRLWDLRRSPPTGTVLPGEGGCIRSLCFSLDGRRLAGARDHNRVRLWDLGDPAHAAVDLAACSDWASALSFDPAGLRLATSSFDGRVALWDPTAPTTAGRLLPNRLPGVSSLVFASGGGVLAGASVDGSIRLWQLRARPIESWILEAGGGDGGAGGLSVSADGARLAYCRHQSLVLLDFAPGWPWPRPPATAGEGRGSCPA